MHHVSSELHQCAAHVVGLRAEDVLDPDAHGGFGPVAALGQFGQRLAPLALAVYVASRNRNFQTSPRLATANPQFLSVRKKPKSGWPWILSAVLRAARAES